MLNTKYSIESLLVCMQSEDIERMESGDFSPAPVHVHVTETTPVHVHTKRIPNRTTQVIESNNHFQVLYS